MRSNEILVDSAYDFDPGTGTDKPTATRGVYISRYCF
jgi:hypothetical protein